MEPIFAEPLKVPKLLMLFECFSAMRCHQVWRGGGEPSSGAEPTPEKLTCMSPEKGPYEIQGNGSSEPTITFLR